MANSVTILSFPLGASSSIFVLPLHKRDVNKQSAAEVSSAKIVPISADETSKKQHKTEKILNSL